MSERGRRHFHLSKDLLARLGELAAKRGVNVSALVEGLLEDALIGESPNDRLTGVESRLASVDRRLKGLRFDMEILGELLSLYIYQWLCHTPPLLESQRAALVAEGRERHKRFIEILSTKLKRGEISLEELFRVSPSEKISPLDDDSLLAE